MLKRIHAAIFHTFGDINIGYLGISAFLLIVNIIICYQISHSRSVLLLNCIFIVLLILFYLTSKLLLTKKDAISTVFLISLLLQGCMYLLVFLPGTVPDEPYHYLRTYELSNAFLFMPIDHNRLIMRSDDIQLIDSFQNYLTSEYYDSVYNSFAPFSSNNALVDYGEIPVVGLDTECPQLRIPAALGIALGRLFNLGSIPLFYLGRLFNFLFFAIAAYFAVKITPIGKQIFMVVSLLPMTLHIAASYSYDAGILAFTFLLAAFLLKAIYGQDKLSKKDSVTILVLGVLLAPCKIIYSVVALLVFLVPNTRFRSKRNAYSFKFGLLILMGLAVIVFRFSVILNLIGAFSNSSNAAPTELLDVRGTEVGNFYKIEDIFMNPLGTIFMFIRTLNVNGDFYINSMVGGTLGWFQESINAPLYITVAFLIILIASIPKTENTEINPTMIQRISYASIGLICVIGIFLSMYLGWTFNTENIILGVQGRYFLPLLPLFLLAFQGSTIITTRTVAMPLIYSIALLNVIYTCRVYAMALV